MFGRATIRLGIGPHSSHRTCYAAFSAMQSTPSKQSNSAIPSGKISEPKSEMFEMLCSWIELCDDELYTLTELHNKLRASFWTSMATISFSQKLQENII